MPRQYGLGGRIAPERGAVRAHSEPPPKQTLRERLAALRNVPPFIASVWRTSRVLGAAAVGLRLLRALLPVATLYVGKLIIDEVTRLLHAGAAHAGWHEWLASGDLNRLWLLLGTEFALAVASDILGRIVSLVDSL